MTKHAPQFPGFSHGEDVSNPEDGLQLDKRKVLQLLDQLAGGLERRNVKAEMFIYRYRGASVPRRPTLCRQC